jgi:hypothetical protein
MPIICPRRNSPQSFDSEGLVYLLRCDRFPTTESSVMGTEIFDPVDTPARILTIS